MPKVFDMDKSDRKIILSRKIKLGATVVVFGGLYVLHRRKLDAAITFFQEEMNMKYDEAFDAGIKYGLTLAKDTGIVQAGQYAFGAFDKAS